ncbi:MAG: tRNA threonylcarbamoyladenosine dehydratase [Muribaculaceae bacterium]|nr:tRNA threonylcarbamoyladenosine dehydratase [Muribaculaceae bacterium]
MKEENNTIAGGPFQRTALMLGREAMERLARARVAVFGVGGVGSYVVEALARSGVGTLELIDNDVVSVSNINRQLVALHSTVGRPKVEVAAERVRDINPECRVIARRMFYLPTNADEVDLTSFDYVADCIDTVSAKMELIRRCTRQGVPIICSMGAAYKLDPTAFRVADITKTMMDPLARVLRKRLRREGINHFLTVYSPEAPVEVAYGDSEEHVPASNAFVPAAAGLTIAGHIVRSLAQP